MPETDRPAVEVYTDGACSGNPGPGGWGVLLRYGRHTKELYGGESAPTTNNRMELTAAIEALEHLTRPSVVRLHTDSTYVRSGITSWMRGWERNGWLTSDRKPVKNADLWRRLAIAVQRHDVEWRWVRGHSGDPGNERADALANRGVAEARASGVTPAQGGAVRDGAVRGGAVRGAGASVSSIRGASASRSR